MKPAAGRAFLIARIALSAGLIALVLRRIEWANLAPLLSTVDFRVALAASTLTLISVLLLALRWKIFLSRAGLRVPYTTVLRLSWAGQFFNSVLPGSIGGDAVKIIELCRRFPEAKATAASTVVLDRITAVVALFLIAVPALIADPVPLQVLSGAAPPWNAVAAIAIAILLAGGAGWLIARRYGVDTRRFAARLAREASGGMRRGGFGFATVLSVLMHFVTITSAFLFAKSLGLTLGFTQAVVMVPVMLVFLMAPVTVNGHGLREVLLVMYFNHFGVVPVQHPTAGAAESAIALSLVVVASEMVCGLPGGLLYLVRPRKSAGEGERERRKA